MLSLREGDARPSILLVDDVAAVRQSLGRYLELSGYHVLPAASVEEAFACLRETAIDAFVLDLQLPARRSGLEVLQQLDEQGPSPVIILSGRLLSSDEDALVRRHRADVFHKPAAYRELVHRLRQRCAAVREP